MTYIPVLYTAQGASGTTPVIMLARALRIGVQHKTTLRAGMQVRRTVSDFARVRIEPSRDGHHVVAAEPVPAGEVLMRFSGQVQQRQGEHSLQVGRGCHLVANDSEAPWIFLSHSFQPNTRIHQQPEGDAVKVAGMVDLTCVTITDVPVGAPISFDYTLHEWDMENPFVCHESGREVRGFMHLTEEEQDAALKQAQKHIKILHMQWLFGQSSRC